MSRYLETNLEMIGAPVRNCDALQARTIPASPTSAFRALNARAVEFIAKPDKIQDLRDCLRGEVAACLNDQPGFSGALLLSSHKEPRLILVLSFWQTEKQASDNGWENTFDVWHSVSSLVDVCSRVHTYEVTLPKLPKPTATRVEMQVW
jgi:hypothetical protein